MRTEDDQVRRCGGGGGRTAETIALAILMRGRGCVYEFQLHIEEDSLHGA